MDAHQPLGDPSVQLPVPLDVTAEADGRPGGDDLENAARGVFGRLGSVDSIHHGSLCLGVGAAHRRCLHAFPVDGVGNVGRHIADRADVGVDGDAELLKEAPGHATGGDAGRRLAGAGALQHVANVGMVILDRAGEVGVAGPQARDWRHRLVHRFDAHGDAPVLPVAVLDPQRDGAAEGEPVPNAGEDLCCVFFDLHPAAATVALLTPGHVPGQVGLGQRKASGDALDDDGQALAMGLAGGQETEARHGAYTFELLLESVARRF